MASGIEAIILKVVHQVATEEVNKAADEIKATLVEVTEQAMDEYYAFPEGKIYVRTNQFHDAYTVLDERHNRALYPTATVGIIFDKTPSYNGGISSEEIYSLNLQGEHGGNGRTSSVINVVNRAADMTVAILGA